MNPILADVRKFRAENPHKRWDFVLRRVSDYVGYNGSYVTTDWERITDPAVLSEARRVVERLARIEAAS